MVEFLRQIALHIGNDTNLRVQILNEWENTEYCRVRKNRQLEIAKSVQRGLHSMEERGRRD
jgi:hypothetical protein